MRPLKQGTLDALCGIYAIVNALEQVGVGGPRSALHQELFEKLILALTPHQLRSGLICGLDADDLQYASRKAFRWLRRTHDVDLRLRIPFLDQEYENASDYVNAIREQSEERQRAVIICVEVPGRSHWTILRSVQGRWVYVRDSGRMRRLDLTRFQLGRGPYRFLPADTIVIMRRS